MHARGAFGIDMAPKSAKKIADKPKPANRRSSSAKREPAKALQKSARARAKTPPARAAAAAGTRRGSLVIVESPAKARTIKKYLGTGYRVEASVGHVKDLPKRELGVDIERDFRPAYHVIEGKAKVISQIKKAAEGRENVFLAPDPDREGEAIAWHIAEELKGSGATIYRVLFNEITKPAVQEALAHPGQLDRKLYEAQQARRVLDRLVGYQISPILWKKVRRGLSAGRVQSVAVRLVVEREREIEAFKAEEYWTVDAKLVGDAEAEFLARLIKIHGKKASIPDRAHADRIVAELRNAPFTVKSVERKERKRNPAPPFTTSSLQMEAARKLRFTAKRTMGLAQKLYEGVELGQEGPIGLITYMRTDSVRVGNEALREARSVIRERYGDASLPAHAIHYKSKKSAQDAHEAIRPTLVDHDPERVRLFLDPDALALYELIWKRFVASQMNPAIYDATTVDIESGRNTLRATGSILKAPGFMALYLEGTDEEENGNGVAPEVGGERLLPELRQGEALRLIDLLPEQHFTKPPARFNEATLVKELEQKGIGRPSTYASILSTIVDKKYVDKEEGKFRPTHLGLLVNDLLVKNFPRVMDVAFTAQMEESLDGVEEGRLNWVETLRDFYGDFRQALTKAKHEMRNVKEEVIKAGITCERCGKDMLVKWGKNGEFLACEGYPDCRNTSEFTRVNGTVTPVEQKVEEGDSCEKCGSAMVRKRGRFGEFLACSAYPDCRNTRPIGGRPDPMAAEPTGEKCDKCGGDMLLKMSRFGSRFYGCGNYPKCKNVKPLGTGVACPEPNCGGEIVQRSSRKGRIFYGCGRYPACTFVLWDKPVAQPCPTCDSPLCVEKYSKKTGRMLRCANKECSFSRPLEEEAATAG
jgi:DNA topoisomerase-1